MASSPQPSPQTALRNQNQGTEGDKASQESHTETLNINTASLQVKIIIDAKLTKRTITF